MSKINYLLLILGVVGGLLGLSLIDFYGSQRTVVLSLGLQEGPKILEEWRSMIDGKIDGNESDEELRNTVVNEVTIGDIFLLKQCISSLRHLIDVNKKQKKTGVSVVGIIMFSSGILIGVGLTKISSQ